MMKVILNYRQSFIKKEICPNNFDCIITIAELDGGGEVIGILELITTPGNLLQLGQDIIMAALEMNIQINGVANERLIATF
jgi:hypothetical protein